MRLKVGSTWSSPAVGDLDGDGKPEIAIGNRSGSFFIFHHNGSLLENFPTPPSPQGEWILSTPALADIDNDEDVELIMEINNYDVYVLDIPGHHNDNNGEWPMFHYDPQNTGCYLRKIINLDTSERFDTIQEAIDDPDTADNDVIKITGAEFAEDILYGRNIALTLSGGYYCSYSNNSSTSTINSLTISNGTVLAEHITIQ